MKFQIIILLFLVVLLNCTYSEDFNSLNSGPITMEEDQQIKTLINQFSNHILKLKNKQPEQQLLNNHPKSTHVDSKLCKSCLWIFKHFHNFMKRRYGLKWLLEFLSLLCTINMKFSVCTRYVNLYGEVIYDSLVDHYLNGELLCSEIYACKDKHFIVLKADDYAKEVLKDKPQNITVQPIDIKAKTLKMLHIADIHVDLKYKEGSKGKCSDPLCCREASNLKLNEEEKAGKWGYLGTCDIPFNTLENFVKFSVNEVKPDFIIWTGDNPAHDPWTGTQNDVYNVTTSYRDLLYKYNYTLPVYPSIGNHEKFPNDEYNPFNEEDKELLKTLGDIFKHWLGEEAYTSFITNGYYSKKHLDTNLRIISVNCLLCDSSNYNLLRNPTDPRENLKWLENTLRQSERNDELVYLIGHIPPGDGFYLDECAKRYLALVDRFSYIIRGQFYGHTHNDEIRIIHEYFDKEKLNGLLYIAPSLTTYTQLHPSFRVYDLDSNTKQVKDYTQYRLNLTKANSSPEDPEWELKYIASQFFNVTYLNETENLLKYTYDVETNNDIYEKALKAFFCDGPTYLGYLNNYKMKKYLSCKFRETTFSEFLECISYKTPFLHEFEYKFLNILSGQWYELLSD